MNRIYNIAKGTGCLERFIIYGSFVSVKENPNDVGVFLVMRDGFEGEDCEEETQKLFDHRQAHDEFGASIFWVCPSAILVLTLEDFI